MGVGGSARAAAPGAAPPRATARLFYSPDDGLMALQLYEELEERFGREVDVLPCNVAADAEGMVASGATRTCTWLCRAPEGREVLFDSGQRDELLAWMEAQSARERERAAGARQH